LAAPLKLRWTHIALEDLQSVWEFGSGENEAAADHIIQHISAAIEQLPRHPNLGRTGRVPATHELGIIGTPYVASYRLSGQEIQVLAVLHGARKWPETF
jgi:toxin ParE1/3/4